MIDAVFWIISIHAPRGGSDPMLSRMTIAVLGFQSTLPAGGATGTGTGMRYLSVLFQSTLPAGGATMWTLWWRFPNNVFQSTLPAGGATSYFQGRWKDGNLIDFNPRSPRGERRGTGFRGRWKGNFNPRSPRGERLCAVEEKYAGKRISIHAPRGGSDHFDFVKVFQ